MNKAIFLMLFLFSISSYSQEIKGTIINEEKEPIEFATVSAINPKDSILISYSNSNSKGEFSLGELKLGKLLFQVNYVGSKTFSKIIDFKGQDINLGKIKLETANELDEVVVSANVPVEIKEDTISYSSKAFKIRVDDNVEDLLKKLPGVEVDINGKIKAQGENVSKIYVDGKEFFRNDPTIAMKNLSADAIKSVEVIDEKTDKSRVSGIEDAETKKVINLKLKEDKKVNNFGNIQGGYGTHDRYDTRGNYNVFSPKFQFSLIGKYNNINSSGSDITDLTNYRGGSSAFVTTGMAGGNLSYEIEDKKSVGADYFYNNVNSTSGDVFTTRTEFIDDLEIKSETRSKNENTNISNNASFYFINRAKKLSSFTVYGDLSNSDGNQNNVSSLDKYNGDGELDLQSISKSFSNNSGNSANLMASYSKRFNESSRRSISVNSNVDYSDSKHFSNNNLLNKFRISEPDEAFNSKQEIIREGNNDNTSISISSEYTEPLAKNHFLQVEGGFSFKSINEYVNQKTTENSVPKAILKYDQFYENTNFSGAVKYKYNKNKFVLTASANFANQNQFFGIEREEKYTKNYFNINPKLRIRYRPKKGEYMFLRMGKTVVLPRVSQLSPVVNNYNPLYIRKGNPNLTPAYKYSVSANYGKFYYDKGFRWRTSLSYSYTADNIVNSEFTDSYGVRTTSYENRGNKNNASFSVSLGKRVKSLNLRYKISVDGGYNEYLSIINSKENQTQSKDIRFGIGFENNKKEVLDAAIGANLSKNYTTFTSGNNADREYFQQSYYTRLDWNITDRLNLGSIFKFNIYTDSNFDSDQSVPIWNGSISYKLLKSKRLNLSLIALDILNKDIGVIRNSSDNYFEETHKDVLGNYYLLSVSYKFGKQ